MSSCAGCRHMESCAPETQNDVYTVRCTDPDKPALGARRVLAVGRTGWPVDIQRPAWCRRKETDR